MGESKRRRALGLAPRNPRPTAIPFAAAVAHVQTTGRAAYAFVPRERTGLATGGTLYVLTGGDAALLHTLTGDFASVNVAHATCPPGDAPDDARAPRYLATTFEYGVFDVALERALVELEDGSRRAV